MFEVTHPLADFGLGRLGGFAASPEPQFEPLNNAIVKAAPRSERFVKLANDWYANVFQKRAALQIVPWLWQSTLNDYYGQYKDLYDMAVKWDREHGGAKDPRLTSPAAILSTSVDDDFLHQSGPVPAVQPKPAPAPVPGRPKPAPAPSPYPEEEPPPESGSNTLVWGIALALGLGAMWLMGDSKVQT